MKESLFSNPTPSAQRAIHQAIRKQVMEKHKLELEQAVGWQKHWIKWKISIIAEIKYRAILFSGVATKML